MGSMGVVDTLITSQVDGAALTASATPASILIGASKVVLPPGYIDRIGKSFRITAAGRISNIITTPGDLTLDIRFVDSAATTVIVANGGAMQLNTVAKTNVPWLLQWYFTARSVGSGTVATLHHQALWYSQSVVGAGVPTASGVGVHMLPDATPAVGTGFNSALANTVDLFATWELSNANSITCHQFMIESMN